MNNKNTIKNATVFPGKCAGKITIPPSKSFAHRAVICAALAKGESHIRNIAYSQDIKATIECMRKLGAEITESESTLTIKGVGYRSVIERTVMNNTIIDCCESGSTLRFLIPVFALSDKTCRFTGKGRLMQRPQDVYAEIFASQYKDFIVTNDFIETKESLSGGIFKVRGNVSSQFISGLLFALPLMDDDSIINIIPPFESRSYVDLTLELLAKFGIETMWLNENSIMVKGRQTYRACDYTVEGDFSQLAFFGVLAAINNDLTVKGVHHNSRQGDKAVIDILADFGAEIKIVTSGYAITKKELHAHEIDLQNCPDLGPVLMVLAAASQGTTVIKNAGRLRIKESDRIAAMETELKKAGVDISSTFDTVTINGGVPIRRNLSFESHNDHRIVMALSVLATILDEPSTISQANAINKSYPNFFEDLQKIGIKAIYQ